MADERIQLGFADVLDLMTDLFEIPAVDGRAALTSRLKHLQAKRFPAGVNVKRARARYDGTAIMGIVAVLALVASFVPPDVAVAIVRENWGELRPIFENAARSSPSLGGDAAGSDAGTLAVIDANALSGLGEGKAGEGRAATTRGKRALRAATREEMAGSALARSRGATVVLDVAALVERAAGLLVTKHGQTPGTVLADLSNLADVGEEPRIDGAAAAAT